MVIIIELENFEVKKVIIDQWSSVDILYWTTYQKLQLPITNMVPYDEPIYGFFGEKLSTCGYIDLHVVFREGYQTETIPVCFLVVEAPTSYNVLLGQSSLNTLAAIVSTPYLAMEFSFSFDDIITIHGDQRLAHECYIASLRPQEPALTIHNIERQPSSGLTLSGEDLDPIIGCDSRIEPVEDTKALEITHGRILKLGVGLQRDDHDIIAPMLKDNTDLFAWSAADLSCVDPQVPVQKLSIHKEARYVSQKKRKLGDKRRLAVKVEVEKLLDVGFIAEAHYMTWLANVVLVKKASGKWWICVDYTDLNKACPKDLYPLPSIDRLVDSAAGNKVLNFLDAYSGYNQIPMAPSDMIKTAFITEDGNYFY